MQPYYGSELVAGLPQEFEKLWRRTQARLVAEALSQLFRILLFLNADARLANHFARVVRTCAEPNAERTPLTNCCLVDLLTGISLGSLFR
jgi:hypothetical protein